jgi:hypothetical protein
VARWMDAPGPWIIDGVRAVHALRKWLAAHPVGKPCDRVLYLTRAHVALSDGQRSMAKAIATVWAQVAEELGRRGVLVPIAECTNDATRRR